MTIHIYEVATVISCFLAALAQNLRPKKSLPLYVDKKWNRQALCANGHFWLLATASGLLLFALSAFRYDVGTDYFFTYRPMFDRVVAGKSVDYSLGGMGRWVISQIIYALGGGHVWFFFITSALVVGLFFWGIYRQSVMPVVSVALFVLTEVYFASLNGVMQYVGLAFVFFGFYYVQQQSFLKYAVFVLIGAFFHPSVVIMLPLYFFSKLKLKYVPIIATGMVAVMSLFNDQMKKLFSALVTQTGYGHYVNTEFQVSGRFYPARIFIYAVVLCIAFALYYKKGSCRQSPFFRFCLYIQLLALFLTLNRNIIPLTDRLVWMLEITHILFLPQLIKEMPSRCLKAALIVGILGIWGIVCWYEIGLLRYHEVLPYQLVYRPGLLFY